MPIINQLQRFTLAALIVLTVPCAARLQANNANDKIKPAATGSTTAQGRADKLQQFAILMSQLGPVLLSEAAFTAASKQASLRKSLIELRTLAHSTAFGNQPSMLIDPVVNFSFPYPQKDLLLIEQMVAQGKEPRAAYHLLNQQIQLCVSCHARTESGRKRLARSTPGDFASWNHLQKAAYASLLWNFEDMIRYYEHALSQKPRTISESEWVQAIKQLLAVIIRHKKHPNLVTEMMRFFIDQHTVPKALKPMFQNWSKDLEAWRAETRAPAHRQEKLERMQQLYTSGLTAEQKTEGSGLINLLRAQNLAIEIIEEPNHDRNFDETLYWAAKITDLTAPYNPWLPANILREACIRHQPHSKLARKCWQDNQAHYQQLETLFSTAELPNLLKQRRQTLLELTEAAKKRPR